jgi:hypothetical protein
MLCFSGNPLFIASVRSKEIVVVYTIILVLYVFFIIGNSSIRRKTVEYSLILCATIIAIIIGHMLLFGQIALRGVLGFFVSMLFAYATISYYRKKDISFADCYIKVISWLTIISIPFWLYNQVDFYGYDIGEDLKSSVFIYTPYVRDSYNLFIRNSGMFWEPGAYAGYLVLGLLFIFWKNSKISSGSYKRYMWIIVVGILTTMSTAGYVVLSMILLIYSLTNFSWGKIIIVPLIAFGISWGIVELPFWGYKIQQQYEAASMMNVGDESNTRFGTIMMDLLYIQSSPIIGNGYHLETRYRFHPNLKTTGFGNGLTDFIADWGLVLFFWWLYTVYSIARKTSNSLFVSLFSVFIILVLLNGQQFLNFPLFLIFFASPLINRL